MNRIKQKILTLSQTRIKIELSEEVIDYEEMCTYCTLKPLIDLNTYFGFNVIIPCQHYIGKDSSPYLLRSYQYFLLTMSWVRLGISAVSPFMDEEPEFHQINVIFFGETSSVLKIMAFMGLSMILTIEITYITIIRITLSKELDKVIGAVRHILAYSIPLTLLFSVIVAIIASEYNIRYSPPRFMWKFEIINALLTIFFNHAICFALLFLQLIIILAVCIIMAFRKIADDLNDNEKSKNISDFLREIDFRHEDLSRLVYEVNDCGKNAIGIAYFISLGEIALLFYLLIYEKSNSRDTIIILAGAIIFLIIFTILAFIGGEIENSARTPFYATSFYIRSPLNILEKMKLLCLMKRLGGSPITVTCMGFFAVNKIFICRAYKALFSTFTTILEIQQSEERCVNDTQNIWKQFI